jgi:hypothetical protein
LISHVVTHHVCHQPIRLFNFIHKLVTAAECSWKVPRVLFPKSVLAPIVVKRPQVTRRDSEDGDADNAVAGEEQDITPEATEQANEEYANYTPEDDEEIAKQREEKEQEEIGKEVNGQRSVLSESAFHALALGMGLSDVIGQLVAERKSGNSFLKLNTRKAEPLVDAEASESSVEVKADVAVDAEIKATPDAVPDAEAQADADANTDVAT